MKITALQGKVRFAHSSLSALALALGLAACGGGGTEATSSTSEAEDARQTAAAAQEALEKSKASSAAMATARADHTATLLKNGKVLVAGGSDGTSDLSSCELYDPVANRWSAAAPMNSAHRLARAVLLADGRVLMSGGGGGHEIYDPASDRWTPAAEPVLPRIAHTATLLADGRVLVVGGQNTPVDFHHSGTPTAEIYDPSRNTWSPAASLPYPRRNHTAARLADGRVLIAGFETQNVLDSTFFVDGDGSIDVYDPVKNNWTPITNLVGDVASSLVAALPTGDVVINRAALKIPSRTWTATDGLGSDRPLDAAFVVLPDGRVVTAGGGRSLRTEYAVETSARVDIYSPATHQWRPGRSLNATRRGHTLTLLGNGKVLATGGYGLDLENVFGAAQERAVLRSTELILVNAAPRPRAVQTDLDGDGKSEILWRNQKTGAVQAWRMQGLKRVASSSVRRGSDFEVASIGDVNGDGRADLVWRDPGTNAASLWLMNGPSALTKFSPYVYGTYNIPRLADLNGDDRAEGLWLNAAGNASIQGPGFDTSTWPGMNAAESVAVTGDFTGDRRDDFVVFDSRDKSTAIWPMLGTVWFGQRIVLTKNSNLRAIAAADFNGDGKTDLLMRNVATGSVAVWLMNGSTVSSKRTVLKLPEWQVVSIPDLNGDGKSDILWYHAPSHTTVGWLMDGDDWSDFRELRDDADWVPVAR